MRTNKEKRRLPTSRVTKAAIFVVKPFLRMKVVGEEFIDKSKPSIFICNHGKVLGPVSAVCYLPVEARPWINAGMLDREKSTATMSKTFRNRFKAFPRLKHRVIWWISGFVDTLLNSYDPIPVWQGDARKSVETIGKTIEVLKGGENVLIFPEKPTERYDGESYKQFYTGFAHIGKAFYESAGRCLDFYPGYYDKWNHEFKIGPPVTYDPSNDPRAEKLRISGDLNAAMVALKDQPKQKKRR